MEVLNQTWEKTKEGMLLIYEERDHVPDPEPSLKDRIALLERRVKEISSLFRSGLP